jgi:hypothetical protein
MLMVFFHSLLMVVGPVCPSVRMTLTAQSSVGKQKEDFKVNFLTFQTCDFILKDQAVRFPVSTILSGKVNVTSKLKNGPNVRNVL